MTTDAPKSNRNRNLGIGCLVVLAALFGCMVMLYVIGTTGDNAPAPTAVPTTAAAAATDRARAATKAPATKVPATKRPATEAPTADAAAAELCTYSRWLVAEMQGIGAAATKLGEASSEAGPNPAVIFTEEWRLRVAASMAVMMNAADSARKQDAPSDAAAVHAQWLDITADLDEASRTIAKGIEDVDAERLGEGFGLINGTTPKAQAMAPDAAALAKGCGELGQTAAPRGFIARGMLSSEWPFTVDSGILQCQPHVGDTQVVTFVVGDKTYAVNGIAKGMGKYLALEEIWADNPSIPGTKVNIGPVIERGRTLCK